MRIALAKETTALATKINTAVLAVLTEEDTKSPLLDEAVWLALQMLCGPVDTCYLVERCQGKGR